MGRVRVLLPIAMVVAASARLPVAPGQPPPSQPRLNQLNYKGTHNSYASECATQPVPNVCTCCNSPPDPNHPPYIQYEDFGCWGLELDFSIVLENGVPRARVGHNAANDTWAHPGWGVYLDDYLNAIRNTRSFNYRPLLLMLEKKDWGDPNYIDATRWTPVVDTVLCSVFANCGDCVNGEVFGPCALNVANQTWPEIWKLRRKVIPYAIGGTGPISSQLVFPVQPPYMTWMTQQDLFNRCVTYTEVQAALANGPGIILRLDQYQNDWTFQISVAPPNPLVVNWSALQMTAVTDGVGNDWSCGPGEGKNRAIVSQQGTFRFPYSQISQAVARGQPGWTVLVRPGHYVEQVTINKKMTLEADGGLVVIGE